MPALAAGIQSGYYASDDLDDLFALVFREGIDQRFEFSKQRYTAVGIGIFGIHHFSSHVFRKASLKAIDNSERRLGHGLPFVRFQRRHVEVRTCVEQPSVLQAQCKVTREVVIDPGPPEDGWLGLRLGSRDGRPRTSGA